MVSVILIALIGCATPPKKHHATAHHRKTVTHKMIARDTTTRSTTPSEDAAVDAIIKSLRENGDED